MAAFIYIEISTTADFNYEKVIMSWVGTEFDSITLFDLDNHSDSMLFQYAATLIEKEEKTIVYIDSKNEAGSGKFLGLAETIVKNKEKCLVIMKGESKILQKMFSLMKENFQHNHDQEEIRALIKDFLR